MREHWHSLCLGWSMREHKDKVVRIIKLGEKKIEMQRVRSIPDLNLILGVSPFDTGIPWAVQTPKPSENNLVNSKESSK